MTRETAAAKSAALLHQFDAIRRRSALRAAYALLFVAAKDIERHQDHLIFGHDTFQDYIDAESTIAKELTDRAEGWDLNS
jgi:hypothetical protein